MYPWLGQSPSPKGLKQNRKMSWSHQNSYHLNNDVFISKGWRSSSGQMVGRNVPMYQELSSSICWGWHWVSALWFSRFRWLLREGLTGSMFGCINMHGLSKSAECNLLQNQPPPRTASFRKEVLIPPPAAKRVGNWQLTAESLSKRCPWLKRPTSFTVMLPWGLGRHPLPNEWLMQGLQGPATWL